MCDPVTAGLAGLQAISSVAGINAQNDAAVANATNAKTAMNDEYASTQTQFIEQNRSMIQGGFDAVLAGRKAEAAGYTSAVENGVAGASVKAMLRDRRMQTVRGQTRNKQEQSSLKSGVQNQFTNIRTKAKGRIASMPTTSFGIGDAASILTPIVRSQAD